LFGRQEMLLAFTPVGNLCPLWQVMVKFTPTLVSIDGRCPFTTKGTAEQWLLSKESGIRESLCI
jgi:hypothetical protein